MSPSPYHPGATLIGREPFTLDCLEPAHEPLTLDRTEPAHGLLTLDRASPRASRAGAPRACASADHHDRGAGRMSMTRLRRASASSRAALTPRRPPTVGGTPIAATGPVVRGRAANPPVGNVHEPLQGV